MDRNPSQRTIKWLFTLYCVMMLWLLLFRRIGSGVGIGRYNLHPLDTVERYIWVLRHSTDLAQRQYAAVNLFGNVTLFVPLGIFLPLLVSKLQRFWKFFFAVSLIISALEVLQMATGLGTLDVDDLILNLVGGTIGFLAWKIGTNLK